MKRQLPPRPNLEQLKKQAKAVVKGHKAADRRILSQIREHHPRFRKASENAIRESRFTLADAQLVIAVQYGFANWTALKEHILALPDLPDAGEAANALFLAANRGDLVEVARLLDAHPGIIDERSGPGTRTALHQAAIGSREELARLLLERGADPNIRCEGDSATPLHFAAEKEHLGIIRLLIEHGADPVGEGDYHELEVIGWATCFGKGDREVVDYLIAHGARHNIFSAVAIGETAAIRELGTQSPANLERRMDLANQRRRPG